MAIYTTELLTDRDYNIPEGRLPLEYAVDQSNKAKTHSENAEVHVSAADREAWNAKLDQDDLSMGIKELLYMPGETLSYNFALDAVINGANIPAATLEYIAFYALPLVENEEISLRLEQTDTPPDYDGEKVWYVVKDSPYFSEVETTTSGIPLFYAGSGQLAAGKSLRISFRNRNGDTLPFMCAHVPADDVTCYITSFSEEATDGYEAIEDFIADIDNIEKTVLGNTALVSLFYVPEDVKTSINELEKHVEDEDRHITADDKNQIASVKTLKTAQTIELASQAAATGNAAIAMGVQSAASGDYALAIGKGASANASDAVVIGRSASTSTKESISIGYGANGAGIEIGKQASCRKNGGISIGHNSHSGSSDIVIGEGATSGELKGGAIVIGEYASATSVCSTVIGNNAKLNDPSVTLIATTCNSPRVQTLLYIMAASSTLANTYEDGEACLGYITKDTSGNVLAAGTRKLSELLTNNTTFAPASLDPEAEPPKVFLPTGATDPIEDPKLPTETEQESPPDQQQ